MVRTSWPTDAGASLSDIDDAIAALKAGAPADLNDFNEVAAAISDDAAFAATVTTALAGKAATSHSHPISDVTSLQASLDSKAATSHVHSAADVTSGTLVIARGGTGQSTAEPAFDALAPTTTRGDIITRGALTNGRLAVGTSGYHLGTDGTDPSWVGFLQSGTGAVTRTWQDKNSDIVSVLDFGADSTGVSDSTTAFRNAVAVGRTVHVPSGTYKLTDIVTLQNGQIMTGDGRRKTMIEIDSDFNMSALGVIRLATSEPGACLRDVGIEFTQPSDPGTLRSDLIQYPPAIYAVNAPRFIIDNVRLSGAWNGLDMSGNNGGVHIGFMEIGAFNKGLIIDGALDFINIERLHFWNFGIGASGTVLGDIWRDGTTIAAEIGRIDGLNIGVFDSLRASLVVTSNANNGQKIDIEGLHLDTNARLTVDGGLVRVSRAYVTTNSSIATSSIAVTNSNASLQIDRLEIRASSSPVDVIDVSSGQFECRGGRWYTSTTANSMVLQSAGRMFLDGIHLYPPDAARTVGFIKSTGGQCRVVRCIVEDQTSGSGPAIEITTDSLYNTVSDNDFGKWDLTLPSNPNLGSYGANKIDQFSWTPTVTFATPGDLSITYAERIGKYWFLPNGVHIECRISFSTNAYTTASGAFRITGLPVLGRATSGIGIALGSASKFDFSASFTQITGSLSTSTAISSTGHIGLQQIGDNQTTGDISSSAVPASTSGFYLTLSGFIPTGRASS